MAHVQIEETYDGDRPVRTITRLFAPQRGRLVAASLAFAVKHSPIWVVPALTATVIEVIVEHRPLRELWITGAIMLAVVAQNLPLHTLYVRWLSTAVRTVETGLRMALSRWLQELSIGYHRRVSAGVLRAKIVRVVENVVEASSTTFDSGMAAVTMLAGAIVLTAIRVPEFLVFFALTVPAAAWIVVAMRRRMTTRNAAFRAEAENMASRVAEMTHLLPVTRARAREARTRPHGLGAAPRARRGDPARRRQRPVRCAVVDRVPDPVRRGPRRRGEGRVDPDVRGDRGRRRHAVEQFRDPHRVGDQAPEPRADDREGTRVRPVHGRGARRTRRRAQRGQRVLDHVEGRVAYDDVPTPGEEPSLAVDHLDLVARPGETVALVGASGSGKSTALNRVIGSLALPSGRVLVDGVDTATVDL